MSPKSARARDSAVALLRTPEASLEQLESVITQCSAERLAIEAQLVSVERELALGGAGVAELRARRRVLKADHVDLRELSRRLRARCHALRSSSERSSTT